MSLASKLKFESLGALASFAFYAIAGVILLIMLPLSGFPPHVAITGVVSIIAAVGLFLKRRWSIWIVTALFFVVSTFTMYTLYYIMAGNIMTTIAMGAYLILTWIFTIYIAKNRTVILS